MLLQEREAPLQALRDGFDRARGGDGHCAIILGEAGIGKTSLLCAFLDGLGDVPNVLRGACEDLTIAEPLGPLRDLAREAGWRLEQDLGAAGGRIAAFSEALAAIEVDPAPTLILVEDLQWADDATVDFLKFLTRRLDNRKLFIVVTARSDDSQGRANVRQMLAGVSPDRVSRIDLKPLSPAAVEILALESGIDAKQLFDITGGNAFYVSEIIKSGLSVVPHSVEDAVLSRLDSVDIGAQALAQAASIFPRRAETGLLRQLLPDNFDDALESCIGQSILELDGEFLAFRHEIARLAIEFSLTPTRRRRLHQSCLELLETDGTANAARRLHHAKQANAVDTLRNLAPQAAHEAMKLGAMRAASEFYALALAHAKPSDPIGHARLLDNAAWANYLIGQTAVSIELQTAAMKIFQDAGDALREGNCCRKLSRFLWVETEIAMARDMADTAVHILTPFQSPELALALSNQSQLLMLDGAYSKVRAPARAAIAMAEKFDSPEIKSHALNNLGYSLWSSDAKAGRVMLQESIAFALKIGDTDNAARGYTNLTFFEMEILDFVHAEAIARNALDYCAKNELDGYQTYLRGALAYILLGLGKWDAATLMIEADFRHDIVEQAEIQVVVSNLSFTVACAAVWLDARQGRPVNSPALRFLERFMESADELQRLRVYATILAELSWLGLADRETALTALRKVLQRAENIVLVADAARWLRRLDPEAEIAPIPEVLLPLHLEITGDWAGAAREWAARSMPFDAAMSLAFGDTDAKLLAIDKLTKLGAVACAEKVAEDMRRAGIEQAPAKPRASTMRNPLGLTNRQIDVLRALNDGLTNAEIGKKLFVSPKTIDHHVSAILTKLDVGSRGEAAAKARKLNIV